MSDDLKRVSFQLLQGGSTASAPRKAELTVVPRREPPPTQLGFPFIRTTDQLVISVGYEGLTQAMLDKLLSTYMPSSVVDIRVSPSFNNHALSRDTVAKALKAFRVKYFHLHELANRFVGDSLDFRWSLERYAASLVENSHVAELHELVEQGPVVLLGSTQEHAGSERAVLIDELKRRWPSFQLVLHP